MKKLYILLIISIFTINVANAQWVECTNFPLSSVVYSLAINGNNIFAGTEYNGVLLSTDNGMSWTAVNNGLPITTGFTAIAIKDSNIYVGTYEAGIYLSTNNGNSWAAIDTTNDIGSGISVHSFAIKDTNIFVAADEGVYLFSSNGKHLIKSDSGLTINEVYAIAISDSNIFAGNMGGGVYLSTNNGVSWYASNIGLTEKIVETLFIRGTNIFAGTIVGLYLSNDNSNSWILANHGMSTCTFHSILNYGNYLIAGTDDGVAISSNNQIYWNLTGLSNVLSLALKGDTIFAGTQDEGVWKRSISEMTAGINENTLNNISIYPNPTKDILTIETNANQEQRLEIINLIGQTIYTIYINKKAIVNTSAFANGVYILKIYSDKETIVRKFVKE
ncbi:MAG: T9SS type A sorting domain-containing protein [Bacteroidota bacterium]